MRLKRPTSSGTVLGLLCVMYLITYVDRVNIVNELIVEERADALVLDCSAYDMSESLFDTVRDHPGYAEFPIVIISDTPEEADASLRAREARRVLLVPKPFTGSQVARALDQLLEAGAATDDLR